MTKKVNLYDSTYSNFTEKVLEAIRKETYGNDIGQNSWITVDEYDGFISLLNLTSDSHVLEVAIGSGGPASYLAGKLNCKVTGIDLNESGVETAAKNASLSNLSHLLTFKIADANQTLPFDDNSFDAAVCMDSMNHFQNRLGVFKEWHRVLRPGARAVFTDPVVITGPVTNDELAVRSSIGFFLFVPPQVNEDFITNAGFRLIKTQDVTENEALVSKRWYKARERHKDDLIQIEGEERFEGLQKFFASVHQLTAEKRLSRIAYLVEK
jgi:SAM-dependent methyltransferase